MGKDILSAVYYFVECRGGRPVEEFIRSLPKPERAKIFAYIAELKRQGHNLRRPIADYVGEGIYELRPKDNRIFYFFFLKSNAVLLYAIKKKTNQIPRNDFELCIRRKKQVEASGKIEKIDIDI